ncbi:MAG: 5'/3'-nucleotidase SurE [Planctomycetes bacterium]|nr:5'/3'-nucleotidase SurE [Planctomycetota bacterium]
MAILLVNDDGIDAPGLAALIDALEGLDDLYVSAPDSNQSGVGMAISIDRDIQVKRHPGGPGGIPRYSLNGTPADAIRFGLQHILGGKPPRLVVSGINHGPNLGRNVRCSGTVGAALEALTRGVPALAVSVSFVANPNWEGAKHYARILTEKAVAMAGENNCQPFLLNLNVPSEFPDKIRGLVAARHGLGGFYDDLEPHPDGKTYSLGGEWIDTPPESGCDAAIFTAGYAVLTPMRFEMTDEDLLVCLKEKWKGDFAEFPRVLPCPPPLKDRNPLPEEPG